MRDFLKEKWLELLIVAAIGIMWTTAAAWAL